MGTLEVLLNSCVIKNGRGGSYQHFVLIGGLHSTGRSCLKKMPYARLPGSSSQPWNVGEDVESQNVGYVSWKQLHQGKGKGKNAMKRRGLLSSAFWIFALIGLYRRRKDG